GRLAGFALGEAHLVGRRGWLRRLGLRFDAPGRLLLRGRRLGGRRHGGEPAAVLHPRIVLFLDEAIRLFAIDRADRVGLRQVQNLARAHEVDVAPDESILVRAEDRDEHLVQAHAWRQIRFRDPSERVAALHFISIRCRGRLLRGGLLRGGLFPGGLFLGGLFLGGLFGEWRLLHWR